MNVAVPAWLAKLRTRARSASSGLGSSGSSVEQPDAPPVAAALASSGRSGCAVCARVESRDYDWETDGCIVFTPRDWAVDGHVIVAPREHAASLLSDPSAAARAMRVAGLLARDRATEAGRARKPLQHTPYTSVVMSTGEFDSRDATLQHPHVHVVPRRDGQWLALEFLDQVVDRAARPG